MGRERAGEENLRRYGDIKKHMVCSTISNYNELHSQVNLEDSSFSEGV